MAVKSTALTFAGTGDELVKPVNSTTLTFAAVRPATIPPGKVRTIYLTGSCVIRASLYGGIPMRDKQNITLVSGDTLNFSATLTEVDGTPINFTRATIRWDFGTAATGIRESNTQGITVMDAVNDKVTIHLTPADTISRSGKTKHELEVTDAAGNVSTVLRGTITIERGVI